ncbi:hypothetical protein [Roseinatronobacter alkalisoli]|uniref:Transposase n=1 Tax=Roseinatronobacter alkalisoli TaxID=3028235 RepID=A0ABT5T637_9RHOB|nr:hypothetical protein [Roseinatronobacter sp. HJB301]MDD7970509.1 hypothetical protein [Roseinatronobacter sp. HJB301]
MQATVQPRWISAVIAEAAEATQQAPLPWTRSAKRARRNAQDEIFMIAGAA